MEMRTSKPSAGNKFYITTAKGGYSLCIQGSPTDSECNVLSNCVGYACGRFNELIGSMKYPALNCNAENFIERAKTLGLEISQKPSLGAIMVWQKGTLASSDGAGHVEVVERIDSDTQVLTSASNYAGTAFYNATRNNSDGKWGIWSGYTFRGFIVNPSIQQEDPVPSGHVGTPVGRDVEKDQVQVKPSDLYARTRPELSNATVQGYLKPGFYNFLEEKSIDVGVPNTSNGYVWYRVSDADNKEYWIARGPKGGTEQTTTWTVMLPKNSDEYVAPFNITVEIPNLNIRKGPGTNYSATGFTGRGLFTIVETATGQGSTKGWGKLMSGAGWVSLDYIKLRA